MAVWLHPGTNKLEPPGCGVPIPCAMDRDIKISFSLVRSRWIMAPTHNATFCARTGHCYAFMRRRYVSVIMIRTLAGRTSVTEGHWGSTEYPSSRDGSDRSEVSRMKDGGFY